MLLCPGRDIYWWTKEKKDTRSPAEIAAEEREKVKEAEKNARLEAL